MKRRYENWKPGGESAMVVAQANQIINEYARDGYSLTLRQLYYQFVSRALIPNNDRSYKRLGEIINRARMAGLLDWYSIEDRTRNLAKNGHWESPQAIIETAAGGYYMDLWEDQEVRVEIWIEKEALAGVVARPASEWDCAYFSCRGYVSQSEQWRAGQRILRHIQGGQRVVLLHLGDHDPSGIDMTRDIRDRITHFLSIEEYGDVPEIGWHEGSNFVSDDEFHEEMLGFLSERYNLTGEAFEVRRIALNYDQVQQYRPAPNPAKMTDSRSNDYVEKFGSQSWELDALTPQVIEQLIVDNIVGEMDVDKFEARKAFVEEQRQVLTDLAAKPWSEIEAFAAS